MVGMPFKDQATSDTLLLPQVPPSSDTDKRRALARLQVLCPSVIDSLKRLHAMDERRSVSSRCWAFASLSCE